MKTFLALLLLIPSLSWSFDSKSLEGATLISKNKFEKLKKNTEFIVIKEVTDNDGAYIVFEEKNRKNIKFSMNIREDVGKVSYYPLSLFHAGSIAKDFCYKYISSRYDSRAVMSKTRSFKFSEYPLDYQVKIDCLPEREFILQQIKAIQTYIDYDWLLDHHCNKNEYYFIEKHNCKVEGLYEEIDYLNKVVNQSKSNIVVQECLDLGFKKGTEGLKNCVLELN